jgi:hypothetical protein
VICIFNRFLVITAIFTKHEIRIVSAAFWRWDREYRAAVVVLELAGLDVGGHTFFFKYMIVFPFLSMATVVRISVLFPHDSQNFASILRVVLKHA